jgi:methylmalonyl-CoA carboxyltransferase 1.3S subunit
LKLQIAIDDKKYEVDVEVLEDDATPRSPYYSPQMPGSASVPSVQPPAARRATGVEDHVKESKVCRSPVAGVVLRVNVHAGQTLQPNDLMIVLEAMKMETTVTAHAAGKVKAVIVQAGDAVKVNQVLAEFE